VLNSTSGYCKGSAKQNQNRKGNKKSKDNKNQTYNKIVTATEK
jgi:hypothetical protein